MQKRCQISFIPFIFFCALKQFETGVMADYYSFTPTHMEGTFGDLYYDDDLMMVMIFIVTMMI